MANNLELRDFLSIPCRRNANGRSASFYWESTTAVSLAKVLAVELSILLGRHDEPFAPMLTEKDTVVFSRNFQSVEISYVSRLAS